MYDFNVVSLNSIRSSYIYILALNKPASSPPIVAVRQVISNLLCERDIQLSTPKPSYRSRGSRLENKFGLNITEDDYVAMKLREKEEKQTRSRKTRLQKDKSIVPKKYTRTKRGRKPAATFEQMDNENENLKDSDIARAVNNLQNVLEYAQTTFDDDISCNIFDSLV
jgi:hypothetical protein